MTKLELAKAFVAQIEEPERVLKEISYVDGHRERYATYAEGSVTYERYKRQLMEARALLMDVLKEVTK